MARKKEDLLTIHNDINRLVFRRFTAADYNVFFLICLRLQGKGQQSVTIYYDDIKRAAELRNLSASEMTKNIHELAGKLKDLDYTVWAKDSKQRDTFKMFTLFPEFDTEFDEDDKGRLIVSVSERGANLINDLTGNFTQLELETFCSLKSKYAKTLYRLLKQFDDTGDFEIAADRFRLLLGVPETYKNKDIIDKVIKPTVEALKPHFPNLEYEAIRSGKQGRPIVRYVFTFTKLEEQVSFTNQAGIDEIARKMKKQKSGPGKNYSRGFNSFKNFEEHDYDFDAIEEALLEK